MKNKGISLIALIIMIVILIVIVGTLTIFLISNKGDNSNTIGSSTNNNSLSTDEQNKNNITIKQIDTNGVEKVYALDNSGNLYAIGVDEKFNTKKDDSIVKISSNIKKFKRTTGSGIIYLDNNNDVYLWGVDYINGGVNEEPEKIFSNAKDFVNFNFVFLIIDNNNKAYVINNPIGTNTMEAGIEKKITEFQGYASNVKDVLIGSNWNGYINLNGELYIKNNKLSEYTKMLDNIKDFKKLTTESRLDYETELFLTKNNELYGYRNENLYKISDNVVEIGERFIKSKNDSYYIYKYNKVSYEGIEHITIENSNSEFALLNFKNIKDILYSKPSQDKYIYVNSDNKLVIVNKKDIKESELTLSSIKEIYNFIIENKGSY